MELITITFAAPGTKRFERAGRYIEVIDAAAAFDLVLTDSNGGQVDYAKGALSGIWLSGAYAAIDITSASAQSITLLITDGQGGSRRQPGTVRVIDSERDKVLAGVCFRAYAQASLSAKAAVQLWNPAGSGKNLFVQAARLGAGAADEWGIQTSNNALAGAGPAPANLDRSGPASVAATRTGVQTTLTGVADHAAGYLPASTDTVVLMPRPILLRPGSGLACFVNSASNTIRACFEWEEWPL